MEHLSWYQWLMIIGGSGFVFTVVGRIFWTGFKYAEILNQLKNIEKSLDESGRESTDLVNSIEALSKRVVENEKKLSGFVTDDQHNEICEGTKDMLHQAVDKLRKELCEKVGNVEHGLQKQLDQGTSQFKEIVRVQNKHNMITTAIATKLGVDLSGVPDL